MWVSLQERVWPSDTASWEHETHIPGWAGLRVASLAHCWRTVDRIAQGVTDCLLGLGVQAHCYGFLMAWRLEREKKCKWHRITYCGGKNRVSGFLKPLPFDYTVWLQADFRVHMGANNFAFSKVFPSFIFSQSPFKLSPTTLPMQICSLWNTKKHPTPIYLQS